MIRSSLLVFLLATACRRPPAQPPTAPSPPAQPPITEPGKAPTR